MEQNTLENLKMIKHTEKELTQTLLIEQNTLENLKIVNGTEKERIQQKMEKFLKWKTVKLSNRVFLVNWADGYKRKIVKVKVMKKLINQKVLQKRKAVWEPSY